MTARNWAKVAARDRMRDHGTESASGSRYRKTDRRRASTLPTLQEPIVIAEWWRDRGGRTIRVRLSSYERHNLIDVRTWFTGTDGVLKPGKGFSASIKHLPRLARELAKAAERAAELGLIEEAGDE